MRLVPGFFNVANRFLGPHIRRDSLDRLPNDVLVDIVFDHLSVLDIIRMRMVSKLYYELTHHAALWKRFLRRVDIPLPPAPLTPPRPMAKISGVEAERIITRAYSLEKNWRNHNPTALREWSFDVQCRVLAMTLLPGGDYLIASITNRACSQYSMVVFDMNHPGYPRAIAAVGTTTKAYGLQAKYMTIKNQRTIVIAYLRRDYLHKKDREKAAAGRLQDVSQYSTYYDIDPAVKFKYECVAMHLPLQNLEALSKIPYPPESPEFNKAARKLPPPFINLFSVTSRSPLTCPVLAEMFGSAYLAVVKGTNDIVFKRLEGGAAATLTCLEEPVVAQSKHNIKAIQLLPREHAIFVVREVDVPRTDDTPCPAYLFETYSALQSGETPTSTLRASEQCTIFRKLGHLTHISIPDFPTSSTVDDLVINDHNLPTAPTSLSSSSSSPSPSPSHSSPLSPIPKPPLSASPPSPPPICVLAHRTNEEAFIRTLFLPQRFVVELPPTPGSAQARYDRDGNPIVRTQVVYRTLLDRNQTWERAADNYDVLMRIIPAVIRPLVYTIPWDDVTDTPLVQDVRPIIDRGWEWPPETENGVVRHPHGWIGCPPFEGGPCGLEMRVSAFAWDETIGRLLIAKEGSNEVIVHDFAASPRPDLNGGMYPGSSEHIPMRDVEMNDWNQPV